MKSEILVTGATGTTSKYVIESLLAQGKTVRAMVRKLDERSAELEEMGAEIVKADFLDPQSLEIALEGIERAYYCYPFNDHLPKAASLFAGLSKKAGVKQVVNMSQLNARRDASSPATLNHYLADELFDWADVGAVHIKPALFAWNYLGFAANTVKAEKKFYFPESSSKFSIIHPKDIADVVSSLLLSEDPQEHVGKRFDLTGPEVYSNREVASSIASVLDEDVEYIPIPVEHWISEISQDPYINDFLATHLKELLKDIDQGYFDKKDLAVAELTGHAPRRFEEYLEEYKEAFI